MTKFYFLLILQICCFTACYTTQQNVTTPLGGLYTGDKRLFMGYYYVYVDIKDNKIAYVDCYYYIKKTTSCHSRDTLTASSPDIYKSDLYTLTHDGNSLKLVNNIKMYASFSGFITFNLQSTTNRERLNELREKCIGKTFKRQ